MSWFDTANTWFVNNCVEWKGLPFQFQTLLNWYINIFRFKFTMDTNKNWCIDWWQYIFFHIAIVFSTLNISSVSCVRYQRVFFNLNYWLLDMKFVFKLLKFYTCDIFVISTKRYEKPSDNTSTVDRDAWYYMWGRFRISTAINLFFHLWNFYIKLSHDLTDALVFWHQVMIASPVVRFISEIKPVRFLWNI